MGAQNQELLGGAGRGTKFRLGLAFTVLWQIWKHRCSLKHACGSFDADRIVEMARFSIRVHQIKSNFKAVDRKKWRPLMEDSKTRRRELNNPTPSRPDASGKSDEPLSIKKIAEERSWELCGEGWRSPEATRMSKGLSPSLLKAREEHPKCGLATNSCHSPAKKTSQRHREREAGSARARYPLQEMADADGHAAAGEPLPPTLLPPAPEVDGAAYGLPPQVMSVLPLDPYEQLDVARKITSMALAARVGRLESEGARLRAAVADRDAEVAGLRAQLDSLDATLRGLESQLSHAEREKEALIHENALLSNTVKKLNRDVSKLEVFKKTLMQSLQDEDENAKSVPRALTETTSLGSGTFTDDNDGGLPVSRTSSSVIQYSDYGSSNLEESANNELDVLKQTQHIGRLASKGSTPKLTPPDSPPRRQASKLTAQLSNPASPRRHSMSFTTARNMFDDKASLYSSYPSSQSNSMTSPFEAINQTGKTRVDGKEFFRQVRTRLSYEQFSAFLANVKELNAHKQTREETLRKADEIFGSENKDLYTIFEGLISRNLQ